MTDTIDIPLDPAVVAALRAGDTDPRRAAARAVLGMVGRRPAPQPVEDVPDLAPEAALPAFEDVRTPDPAAAASLFRPPASGEAADVDDLTVPPAANVLAETAITPARAIAAADPAPAPRGDVYIAHYYARLPGDTAINPYTRLGGHERHG